MGFATRTTINRSTGFTAAQLNFGRDLKFPLDSSLQPTQNRTDKSPATFAADLRKRLTESVREAREHLDISRLDQTSQYDKRRRDVQFSMGDLVLKRTHPLSDASKGFTASLAHRWDGPYTVVEDVSEQQSGPPLPPSATRTLGPAPGFTAPPVPATVPSSTTYGRGGHVDGAVTFGPPGGLALSSRVIVTQEELAALCEVCQVPEISWRHHRAGALHRERSRALRANRPEGNNSQDALEEALAMLRRLRPDQRRQAMDAILDSKDCV
ncbi:uncharacterized protein LOC144148542 [Haemaphysalis longicornis]